MMAKEEAYIKMSPWRSEVEHLEREIMRLEKDRQLKARLIEEENLEKKRDLRQVQEALKEREMENSLLKVSPQLCYNEDIDPSYFCFLAFERNIHPCIRCFTQCHAATPRQEL